MGDPFRLLCPTVTRAADKQDLESIELAAPVDVPVPGDATGGELTGAGDDARRKAAAPKGGPAALGGGFAGLGCGRGAPQARRYAFRRS
jgi:hypothetical protein